MPIWKPSVVLRPVMGIFLALDTVTLLKQANRDHSSGKKNAAPSGLQPFPGTQRLLHQLLNL